MDVVVQSFGEFKSAQMANAADSLSALRRYVLAESPSGYDGPASRLTTYSWLRYAQSAGNRLVPTTDLSGYWTNRCLDAIASRANPSCDLFVGYSGSCLQSLETAAGEGAVTVVYRGAPHGQFFFDEVDKLLRQTGFDGVTRDTPRLTPREHREFQIADIVWTPSEFTADSLTTYGIDAEKIRICPYGIDLNLFGWSERDPGDGPLDLLYVGDVSPEKGVHVLLTAMEELEPEEAQLTLIGKVSEQLTNRITEADNVSAKGWVRRSNLAQYYQQASAFVFPSFADGYPSALLEALACGCPVITTEHVGLRELLRDHEAGIILEPGSASAIVDAIRTLFADPARLGEMSSRAADSIVQNDLDLESRQQRIADFLSELAAVG